MAENDWLDNIPILMLNYVLGQFSAFKNNGLWQMVVAFQKGKGECDCRAEIHKRLLEKREAWNWREVKEIH